MIDPDVERARRVAHLLTKLADKLEKTPEQFCDDVNRAYEDQLSRGVTMTPEPQPFTVSEATRVQTNARKVICRIHDAWMELSADNGAELKTIRRSWLDVCCKTAAAMLRHARRNGEGAPPNAEDNAVQMAVGMYANDVPEQDELIRQHKELVRDYLRALGRVKGAPRVETAAEKLYDAMNYPAAYRDAKRTARRRRARAAREGGQQVSALPNRGSAANSKGRAVKRRQSGDRP